jgi:pyroglutamyl-peptidase
MPLRILVTGFEPFQGAKRNPSGDTAKALDKKKVAEGVVTGVVLPVLWDVSAKALDKAITSARPHIVVSLGMADETFRVEQLADDQRIDAEDNNKVNPGARPAKKRLATKLPVDAVEKALIKVVGAARVSQSKDAGGFICNEVFYTLMKGYPKLLRSGFIHTPSDAVVPQKLKQSVVEDAINAALAAIVGDLSPAELKSAK